MTATGRDLLDLMDYRARTMRIYPDVRERLDEEDPLGAHAMWKQRRDELWRTHPASPVPVGLRDGWPGLRYWPYNPELAFTVPFEATAPLEGRDEPEETITLHGHKGPWGEAVPCSIFDTPVGKLFGMWLIQYGGGLFVAFRDATNGDETYGGGKYLIDTPKGAYLGEDDGDLRLDLNFSYHPSCARSPEWNCPLGLEPPLPAIHAGEKLEVQVWC